MKDTIERFSRVQAAMSKVGIDKSGKNKQQGYMYRGIDQVMNTLSPILAEQGLLVIPSVTDHKCEQKQTAKGGIMYHHTVRVEYRVIGPDGELGPFTSAGECLDMSDKGLNKACTAAYKYWVLTTLCVPLEGQDDADSETHEVEAQVLGENERKEILGLCMQTGTEAKDFCAWLGYEDLAKVPMTEYARAMSALTAKLKKMTEDYAKEQQDTAQSMEAQNDNA